MLWPRWLFLRALGLIFGSAFYSLIFQIHGLIGPRGILPADAYLDALRQATPWTTRLWAAPTLLWLGAGDRALTLLVAAGLVAAVLLTLNVWPRLMAAVCTMLFLSCVAALQDFSSYQSDGMLLQAGVAAVLLAPPGVRPGLGARTPPARASVWLLRWEWLSIYFGSGLVKILSGDPQWRSLTAMDHYYENSPLPSWVGWYAQQLPHSVHAATALLTLVVELGTPAVLLVPRRPRLVIAMLFAGFQLGIIATANYAFLNYLVLVLGVFLVDDPAVVGIGQWIAARMRRVGGRGSAAVARVGNPSDAAAGVPPVVWPASARRGSARLSTCALAATVYVSLSAFLGPWLPAPVTAPARFVAPFRIANAYGLFAVMTAAEYEIEFQGLRADSVWVAYPFRYKPQDPAVAPGLYAPYQPRFEWNLWFASLGPWTESPWVVTTQARLLATEPTVLALFASNPFASSPPLAVRTVLWRYWFTDGPTRRRSGRWWNREMRGVYTGVVARASDGSVRFDGRRAPGDDDEGVGSPGPPVPSERP
jgi:lipase maturation factor 1